MMKFDDQSKQQKTCPETEAVQPQACLPPEACCSLVERGRYAHMIELV